MSENWLERQMRLAAEDVKQLPDWLRTDKMTVPLSRDPAALERLIQRLREQVKTDSLVFSGSTGILSEREKLMLEAASALETLRALADGRWAIIERLTKQHNEWKAQAETLRAERDQARAEVVQFDRERSEAEAKLAALETALDGLHQQIINIPPQLPARVGDAGDLGEMMYRIGHRDARHAAAELIADLRALGGEETT